jgi:hypothetical protein
MTDSKSTRAAVALSILDALDALNPGQGVMIAREPHAPFGGLVVVTKTPKRPQRVFTSPRAIDALAAALLDPHRSPMTPMSCENTENLETATLVSYPKHHESKKPRHECHGKKKSSTGQR